MPRHALFAVLLLLCPQGLTLAQGVSVVRVTQTTAVVEQPEGSAASVGMANPGEVLETLDERDGWLLVRPPAGSAQTWRTGWINARSTEGVPGNSQLTQPAAPPPEAPRGRKGFIIGLGGGIGLHRHSEPLFGFGGFDDISYSSVGLATEFSIGYAPSDRVLVYYANAVQFSTDSPYDLVGLTGGGITYAIRPQAPSWYISGAIGAATGAEVDFGNWRFGDVERGLAFSAGGGHEFARHWLLGGSAMVLELDGVTHTVRRGTITWMFY
ncbi:MAG: hypothetical protein AB7I50_25510 [Vicinamibacterales bacterium]